MADIVHLNACRESANELVSYFDYEIAVQKNHVIEYEKEFSLAYERRDREAATAATATAAADVLSAMTEDLSLVPEPVRSSGADLVEHAAKKSRTTALPMPSKAMSKAMPPFQRSTCPSSGPSCGQGAPAVSFWSSCE